MAIESYAHNPELIEDKVNINIIVEGYWEYVRKWIGTLLSNSKFLDKFRQENVLLTRNVLLPYLRNY